MGILLYKLCKFIPEGPLKNKMRSYYYNHFVKADFTASYKMGCFQFKFNNGIAFKCYNTIWGSRVIALKGYLARYRLEKGNTVIDCGAGHGAFVLYAAKVVGDTGRVIAFEPDSLNHKKLLDNIELNNLANVTVINKGVWSENTTLIFNEEHTEGSSLFFDGKSESTSNIPVVSIDNELKRIGIKQVNFIKMDIEGAEIEAIRGAKEVLKNNYVNLAVVSYHAVNGEKTCFELEKLFSKLRYKTETSFPEHLTTYATKDK